jgi:hypothetical protein
VSTGDNTVKHPEKCFVKERIDTVQLLQAVDTVVVRIGAGH